MTKARASGASPWIKIDPNYVSDPALCKLQSSNSPRNDSFERGCFVLSHNDPLPDFPRVYNTTDDVLAWVADPANAPFFQGLPDGLPFTIALCFKFTDGDPCNASSLSRNWLALVDDFYLRASAVIDRVAWLRGSLEFLLDGAATPSDTQHCLYSRWTRWNATYVYTQGGAVPLAAAFSDDSSAGYQRFQVLNEPEYSPVLPNATLEQDVLGGYLAFFQLFGYGKFSAPDSPYPILFWEPSDQLSIRDVIATYRQPLSPAPPPGGLRFAINIDPAQFQVYSASGGANAQLQPPTPAPSSRPITVPAGSSIFTFYSSPDPSLPLRALLQTAPGSPAVPLQTGFSLTGALTTARCLDPDALTFLISDVNGLTAVLLFDPSASSFSTLYFSSLLSSPALTFALIATIPLDPSSWMIVQAALTHSPSEILLSQWLLRTSNQSWSLNPQPEFTGTVAIPPSYGPALTLGFDAIGGADRVEGLIAVGTTQEPVPLCLFQIDSGGLTPLWLSRPATGNFPSVSLAIDPCSGTSHALVLVGDSFCFNSEAANKDALVALCDSPIIPTPGVLAYHFAPISSWKSNALPLDACNPSIFTGSYDQGLYPSALLVPSASSASSNPWASCLKVLATHQTFYPSPLIPNVVCGASNALDSIVIDSWILPQHPQNKN
ncbi:MAG: hypothetical protein Q8P67_20500 [archaeon]|nr:hypothetical protein [archaeon]